MQVVIEWMSLYVTFDLVVNYLDDQILIRTFKNRNTPRKRPQASQYAVDL